MSYGCRKIKSTTGQLVNVGVFSWHLHHLLFMMMFMISVKCRALAESQCIFCKFKFINPIYEINVSSQLNDSITTRRLKNADSKELHGRVKKIDFV